MIQSKKDYQYYLTRDSLALGIKPNIKISLKSFFIPNYIWQFQKTLRKLEYYTNCKTSIFSKFHLAFLKLRFRRLSLKLSFSIPINVFGPGLAIVHYGTIVVNKNAKIGKNCRIHASTNIGASGGSSLAPQLGDNIYIAPGVVIYGDIKLANNIAIAANSTVYKSIKESNVMIAGTPAKVKKGIDINILIRHANT
ncbi:hypothetical protein [Saccharicrinis aurantiacus]|uniref:hypothetical protein n=1 Tax=Saccharicrinis aurantiacus TaxID=1849719 RepID=UPI002490A841|nr:hypothetical protein [Saccharicrinis aurantiacus]